MSRLLIGLFKGLVIGGAVGALFHFGLKMPVVATSWINYLLYGALGALTGALSGRAPWKPGAWVAGILKAVFGIGVGIGLYALASHFLKVNLPVLAAPAGSTTTTTALFSSLPLFFAPALAIIYASLVELDDGGENAEPAVTGVRAGGAAASEAEAEEPPAAKRPATRQKGN